MGKTHNPCALPPLTTEDHVPPEELLLDCWVTGTSPGALWDMKSTRSPDSGREGEEHREGETTLLMKASVDALNVNVEGPD